MLCVGFRDVFQAADEFKELFCVVHGVLRFVLRCSRLVMNSLYELAVRLSRRTDLPRVVSLPRNTVVTVGGKCFRLMEKTYVVGTPDDRAAVQELFSSERS